MLKTTKSKFVFYSVLFIIFSAGIPTFFLLTQFARNFEERSEILLNTSMDILEFGVDNAMMLGSAHDLEKTINDISLNDNIYHVRLFRKDGKIVYSSVKEENGKNIFKVAPDHVDSSFIDFGVRNVSLTSDLHAYTAFQPIINKPDCQSCHEEQNAIAYLDIDTHITETEKYFISGINSLVFLSIIMILLLVTGFYYSFSHFINIPLNNFMNALDKVVHGNLDTRLKIEKDDEFGHLNRHFNRMVEEIKTSREEIEELHFKQLQHADKLATIGELTSSIAHEINNYSAIMLSRTDYLRLEAENNIHLENYKNDLEVIEGYVEKITKITKNILRHSKKINKEFSNIDLTNIVEQSIQMLEPILSKKNISITKNIKGNNNSIWGDSAQIEQIITNLINNAADAIGFDGEINITIRNEDSDTVILVISDTGNGIDHKSQKNIFAPFYTTKSEGKGTGLGLYIVKNICKNHKAKIELESEIGKGTTFTITFRNKETE
ncbi:MAG: HAMP domain-containing histidine kinase [Melioribacteraceae bacterium]|nr:HAMP domain-containing histidine kinase [Melioribacteraceae bacterium]